MSEKKAPKLRFKGYTDDWVQCKLGEILSHLYNGQTPSRNVKNYWNGDIPWLTSGELNHGIVNNTLETISESGKKSANLRLIPSGTIVIAITGLEAPGTRGNCAILGINTTVNQSVMALFVKNNIDTQFVFQWYKKIGQEYGIRYTQGTKQQSYNYDIVKILPISIPLIKKEQEKIGKLLIQFDSLITLQQLKIDQLNKVKKALLQQMFPEQDSKIPKTRFSRFTDPWEQRKLGEFIIEYNEKTTLNNQYPVLTSSRKGLFLQKDYFSGNQIASIDNTGYNVVPYGYFTYRHMSDDNIFWFNINTLVRKGIVSTLYPVFTTNAELDSQYLQLQLNFGDEFARYALLQKQGGSRTYMYLKKLKQLRLTIPKTLDEQETISYFFDCFDSLIALHQRKLDQLKQVKKFLLQNMFI